MSVLLCSSIAVCRDEILAEVGRQCARGLGESLDHMAGAKTYLREQIARLDETDFAGLVNPKDEALRYLISKAIKAIDRHQAEVERKDTKLMSLIPFIYCPRLARVFYESIKKRGSADEPWLDILSTPGGHDGWKTKVYSLTDIDEKLDGVDKLLKKGGYTVETEGVIASLSVWKPLLLKAGMPEVLAKLNAIIDRNSEAFLLQRAEFGIPINRELSSLTAFLIVDKQSDDTFKSVYEDDEVSQLVKSLSAQVFLKSVSSRFSPDDKRQWVARKITQAELDDSLAKKIASRELPVFAGALKGCENIPTMQALKGLVMTPRIVDRWMEDLAKYQEQEFTRDQATKLIAELSDTAALIEDRRVFYTLDELESKVTTVANILENLTPMGGTLAVIHSGVLVNIAMWWNEVQKQSSKSSSSLYENVLSGLMSRHLKHFGLQRSILDLPSFTLDAKKDTISQVEEFLEDERNLSNEPFLPLYFTVQEADAMRKASLYVEIMGMIGKIKVIVDFALVKQVQKRIFRRS